MCGFRGSQFPEDVQIPQSQWAYHLIIKRGNGTRPFTKEFPSKTYMYRDFPLSCLITRGQPMVKWNTSSSGNRGQKSLASKQQISGHTKYFRGPNMVSCGFYIETNLWSSRSHCNSLVTYVYIYIYHIVFHKFETCIILENMSRILHDLRNDLWHPHLSCYQKHMLFT